MKSRNRVSTAGLVLIAAVGLLGVPHSTALADSSAVSEGDRPSVTIEPRISKYSIQLSPRIIKAGQRLTVNVSGVFQVKSCALTLIQGRQQARANLPVRNSSAQGRIVVPRTFKGSTIARVACGKDGTATSDPIMVVGPNEPTAATCNVLEYGFGVSSSGYAYSGLIVRNSAPSLAADDVEIALTYRDAAGRVVKTDTIRHYDGIAPATTVILAGSTSVGTSPTSLTVATRCSTSTKAVPVPLPSSGTIVAERFSMTVQGEFRNSYSRTVSRSSKVAYLVRNASGTIVGGDIAYTDAFVSPGGIGTWDDYVFSGLSYTVADSVEANVFPRFD